jgi:hypothetical protein
VASAAPRRQRRTLSGITAGANLHVIAVGEPPGHGDTPRPVGPVIAVDRSRVRMLTAQSMADPPSGSALPYPGENSSSSSEKDSNRCDLLHVDASYSDVLMSAYCNSGMVQDASHSRSR